MNKASEIKDQELARSVRLGSKEGFRMLYERYGGKIHAFSYSYLKSEHDAEELVQDVFLKIWDKRDTLDETANIRSFIYKIAVNSIYDFIRRKNVERAFSDFSASTKSFSDETWQDVVFHDMVSQIEGLVQKMPDQRRQIFRLSKEQGFSNEEIAAKLNLSKRTVENQLYRATAFLKQNLILDSTLATLVYYLFC